MKTLPKTMAATMVGFMSSMPLAQARPIEVVGTGDGMELVRAVSAAFTSDYPDTVVLVPPSIGSGGGIAAVGAGKAPLARVARPLKPAEIAAGLQSLPVFRLPSAFYINSEIGIGALSHEQLRQIYSGEISNWKRVGGPDLRIKVVRREETDSTLSVLRQSMPGWHDLELTSRSKVAVTTQDAVETVSSTPGAIGFGPFSRMLESVVLVLKIDGLHPKDLNYPSAVTVSYVWRDPLAQEDVKRFVDYASTDKAKSLLSALGAVPLMQQP